MSHFLDSTKHVLLKTYQVFFKGIAILFLEDIEPQMEI